MSSETAENKTLTFGPVKNNNKNSNNKNISSSRRSTVSMLDNRIKANSILTKSQNSPDGLVSLIALTKSRATVIADFNKQINQAELAGGILNKSAEMKKLQLQQALRPLEKHLARPGD